MTRKQFHAILILVVLVGTLFVVGSQAWLRIVEKNNPQELGVTYSIVFASQLGVDWREAYIALLDEVGVRKFRIPVYWPLIEPEQGEFYWDDYDWMFDEAAKRDGVEITLAIGRKVPRWPECFIPDWVYLMSETDQEQAVLGEVQAVVERYRDRTEVVRWQVENEPFLFFGECPTPSLDLLEQEIELVQSLDHRPIQQTASGEQEPWADAAARGDVLGVSMYRLVWNDIFGFAFYPLGPGYYRARAGLVAPLVDEVIVSELQAEPWFTRPINEISIEEQYESFDVKALEANVRYSKRTGLAESYLWGAEWWYYMREHGDSRHWQSAQEIFK